MRRADTQQPGTDASVLERLPFRRVVIWAHATIGFISLFVYLNYLDLSHFAWWTPRASIRLLVKDAPVLLPHAISAGYSWQLYTWQVTGPNRVRIGLFVAVLLLGAALIDTALLRVFGDVGGFILIQLLGVQAWAYLWAASLMLDVI